MLKNISPLPGDNPSGTRPSAFAPEPGEASWHDWLIQHHKDNPYERLNPEDRPGPDPVFNARDFAPPVSGYIAPGIHISQRGNGNWLLHVETGRGVQAYESESREALIEFAKKKRTK